MKIIALLLAALALSCAGCINSDLSRVQGLTLGTASWSESYPTFSVHGQVQGVTTDSVSGITKINSVTWTRTDPLGAGTLNFSGLELDPKKPVPAIGSVAPTK